MNGHKPFPTRPEADADRALADLEPILPLLWEALEVGVVGAVSYFLERNEAVDASLFPNLVRYIVKTFLARRSIDATDEGDDQGTDDAYRAITLSNNGLCIVHGRYVLRIRKSDGGQVPVPGKSLAMQRFYRQEPLPFNLLDPPTLVPDTSLLLLWDVDALHHLAGLTLVRPSDGDTTRSSVQVDWILPIENPLLVARSRAVASDPTDELEEIQLIDIPNIRQQPG